MGVPGVGCWPARTHSASSDETCHPVRSSTHTWSNVSPTGVPGMPSSPSAIPTAQRSWRRFVWKPTRGTSTRSCGQGSSSGRVAMTSLSEPLMTTSSVATSVCSGPPTSSRTAMRRALSSGRTSSPISPSGRAASWRSRSQARSWLVRPISSSPTTSRRAQTSGRRSTPPDCCQQRPARRSGTTSTQHKDASQWAADHTATDVTGAVHEVVVTSGCINGNQATTAGAGLGRRTATRPAAHPRLRHRRCRRAGRPAHR